MILKGCDLKYVKEVTCLDSLEREGCMSQKVFVLYSETECTTPKDGQQMSSVKDQPALGKRDNEGSLLSGGEDSIAANWIGQGDNDIEEY